jgi:putative heme-binding domain-containing protein
LKRSLPHQRVHAVRACSPGALEAKTAPGARSACRAGRVEGVGSQIAASLCFSPNGLLHFAEPGAALNFAWTRASWMNAGADRQTRERAMSRAAALSILVTAMSVSSLPAQHGYSTAEIAEGGRLFQAACARCHGPEGDGVAGLNFSRGQFRRAASDDEIARIIIAGIPGTGMPPGNFSEFDAGRIVAYVRSMAAAPAASGTQGDPVRGKAVVEGKGRCLTCHRVDAAGSQLGPDLNSVGPLRRTGDLQRSLIDPDAEILDDNRSVRVITRGGETITGRLLNQDSFSIQLFDEKERLLSFLKSDLREYGVLKSSPMPSYKDTLSAEELADVVSYLRSLRGRP